MSSFRSLLNLFSHILSPFTSSSSSKESKTQRKRHKKQPICYHKSRKREVCDLCGGKVPKSRMERRLRIVSNQVRIVHVQSRYCSQEYLFNHAHQDFYILELQRDIWDGRLDQSEEYQRFPEWVLWSLWQRSCLVFALWGGPVKCQRSCLAKRLDICNKTCKSQRKNYIVWVRVPDNNMRYGMLMMYNRRAFHARFASKFLALNCV